MLRKRPINYGYGAITLGVVWIFDAESTSLLAENLITYKKINMKVLKIAFVGLAVLLFSNVSVMAQDEISDQDLYNYALMDLSKDAIVAQISPMVNDLIAQQEGMTGQRFQELQKAKGNFASVDAKEWEIKFYNLVEGKINKKKEAAGEVVKVMASQLIGASTYKAIKAGLKNDADLKGRYEAIRSAMEASGPAS